MKIKPVEDFDPRPPEYRGAVTSHLQDLLEKLRGEQLCVSFLFDPKCQHWDNDLSPAQLSSHSSPDATGLKCTIAAFKSSLRVSEDQARRIEQNTRKQRQSSLWYSVRRYRITSSIFGSILSRRDSTPPDSLVLRIIQPRSFSTVATKYGLEKEAVAVKEYVSHQHSYGHPDLTVSPSGFIVSCTHSFLGASPDGVVYDPSNMSQPFGFLEVKCPYSARNVTPVEACTLPGFCCETDMTTGLLTLKKGHPYYSQVQGQMAIGERPWCNFVVFTGKGLSVQRIEFDESFWKDRLLPKLVDFYNNCVVPEIVSPVHPLGLPIRDLSKT